MVAGFTKATPLYVNYDFQAGFHLNFFASQNGNNIQWYQNVENDPQLKIAGDELQLNGEET